MPLLLTIPGSVYAFSAFMKLRKIEEHIRRANPQSENLEHAPRKSSCPLCRMLFARSRRNVAKPQSLPPVHPNPAVTSANTPNSSRFDVTTTSTVITDISDSFPTFLIPGDSPPSQNRDRNDSTLHLPHVIDVHEHTLPDSTATSVHQTVDGKWVAAGDDTNDSSSTCPAKAEIDGENETKRESFITSISDGNERVSRSRTSIPPH